MGWDTLSIQNDPGIPLIHTSSNIKYEEVSRQYFEPLVYHVGEKQVQYEYHIGIHVFDHHTNDKNIDPLFLKVQSDLVTNCVPPPESFHPSSPLAHYSLYPYMFDKFVTPATPLNPFDIYLANHGCNHVQDGEILQSKDENLESR